MAFVWISKFKYPKQCNSRSGDRIGSYSTQIQKKIRKKAAAIWNVRCIWGFFNCQPSAINSSLRSANDTRSLVTPFSNKWMMSSSLVPFLVCWLTANVFKFRSTNWKHVMNKFKLNIYAICANIHCIFLVFFMNYFDE